jgi:hypothetical protein
LHDHFDLLNTAFRGHARAEKKCAASPGGTFFILLRGPALSINPTQLHRKRRF